MNKKAGVPDWIVDIAGLWVYLFIFAMFVLLLGSRIGMKPLSKQTVEFNILSEELNSLDERLLLLNVLRTRDRSGRNYVDLLSRSEEAGDYSVFSERISSSLNFVTGALPGRPCTYVGVEIEGDDVPIAQSNTCPDHLYNMNNIERDSEILVPLGSGKKAIVWLVRWDNE